MRRRMRCFSLSLAVFAVIFALMSPCLIVFAQSVSRQEITSPALPKNKFFWEQIKFYGRKRVFCLFIPETLDPSKPAPLLLALHGAGRDGESIIAPWKELAKEKGIVLVAPNARNEWYSPADWPDFLYAVVESIKVQINIDPRRVYIFGHSAGGIHAAATAVLESEYFAAAAVHAAYLPGKNYWPPSDSRIPIAFWIGTLDEVFSVEDVESTANVLKDMGFPVRVTTLLGHDHQYYRIAAMLNKDIWSFLESKTLNCEPHWIDIGHDGKNLQLRPYKPGKNSR
jgi:predicted esterase